ncbi:MAG: class I SAM-dependent RNA methyltransferase [Candidatus Omnitrophica bacterium]|nr:class I SAM-dependent RNA methyltransferase [Candidatus Omnitrophota bacterium]
MEEILTQEISADVQIKPLCPLFGECGGCAYQHVTYEYELELKHQQLSALFQRELGILSSAIDPVVPSLDPYHYRHRLDLTMRTTREGFMMGFQHAGRRKVISVESCVIARKEVSNFLPQLKEEAIKRWPEDYNNANLVVRTGDDGRVVWGGIGRRSLELPEADYLWTQVNGKKIFYSLDSFFQANLGILPEVMKRLGELAGFDRETLFLDLYAGVGLFGICFSDQAGEVIMVEDSDTSVKLMEFNVKTQSMKPSSVLRGKVEEVLPGLLEASGWTKRIALVDPPRKGLHSAALTTLAKAKSLTKLFYLSCGPDALVRDLKIFLKEGWKIERILPFDFFPRTAHLETLVMLVP